MTRHPVNAAGRKTRGNQPDVGWAMFCDVDLCQTRSEVRPGHDHLPLAEFVAGGWFIARLFGDTCPACLSKGVEPTAEPWRQGENEDEEE